MLNTQPPMCVVHVPGAVPTGVIAQQDTDDPEVVILRLMKDRDPTVRLRAAKELADIREKQQKGGGCFTCASLADREAQRADTISRLTPAQEGRLRDLVAEVKAIMAAAALQPIEQETPNAAVIEHHQSPGQSADRTAPTADRTAPAEEVEPQVGDVDAHGNVLVDISDGLRIWEPKK